MANPDYMINWNIKALNSFRGDMATIDSETLILFNIFQKDDKEWNKNKYWEIFFVLNRNMSFWRKQNTSNIAEII